ncbi:actin-related protein 2/3 complex subunit 1A isoform X4 [Diospyros lotus]|uniref:actin-related protein 2/3 complex subunit 1A isoform X4 n=1 Tax=Diospyros lotus TaxID=55363 RepID=UPI002258A78B|nr:actin-related protein 2/3 complex subunit 1A isoform X4 [Diospyros lotus]
MAAIAVHQLAPCITCHAWSPDFSMIAFCPNNNEVHIYKFVEERWEKKHVLQKHDQIVSGIDWSARSNRLVTVSHDRNSYVWNQEGEEWVPTLVILRLNRAALCVQWSPRENKFSVGSGAKTVCICYYEQDNNWWVSKLIRKRHESSVTCVAWHPNNILLATTSTDGKCRVFSTFIKGVDPRDPGAGSASDSKFGEVIIQQSTSLMKLVLLLQLKLWHFVICLFVMSYLFLREWSLVWALIAVQWSLQQMKVDYGASIGSLVKGKHHLQVQNMVHSSLKHLGNFMANQNMESTMIWLGNQDHVEVFTRTVSTVSCLLREMGSLRSRASALQV